jgi:hypothetical protein
MNFNFYGCTFFLNANEDLSMKVDEMIVKLEAYVAQTTKVFDEITGLVADMQAQIAALNNMSLPPEAVDVINSLGFGLQKLDDVVPDAEAPVEE